jgi:polysaccharide biosynthesis transport protein
LFADCAENAVSRHCGTGHNKEVGPDPAPPVPPDEETTLLQHYADVFRRRKWLVLAPLLVAPVLALAYALTQAKSYEASADVLLREPDLAQAVAGLPTSTLSDRTVLTQAQLARVPAVLRATLARVPGAGLTIDDLSAATTVSNDAGSALLDITARADSPRTAERLAAAYATAFVRYRALLERRSLAEAGSALDRQISAVRAKPDAVSRAVLAGLVERRQELATLDAFSGQATDVVRTPDRAVQVAPQPVRDVGVGVALGLVLGCGLALLWDGLDPRVRRAEDVAGQLGLPLLGRVPNQSREAFGAVGMLGSGGPHFVEAIRTIRANLELGRHGRTLGSVMVTSAVGGEGKTTTAANLAVALAQSGHRVALCDLDSRRPRLHALFGLADGAGLVDVALGTVGVGSAVHEIRISSGVVAARRRTSAREGRLLVMPFGRTPVHDEPVVFNAVPRILAALRQRADVVLIDAAPLLLSGEAIAATSAVDAVVLVANVRVLRPPMLAELRRLLLAMPAEKLGVVVTGTPVREGLYASTRTQDQLPVLPLLGTAGTAPTDGAASARPRTVEKSKTASPPAAPTA